MKRVGFEPTTDIPLSLQPSALTTQPPLLLIIRLELIPKLDEILSPARLPIPPYELKFIFVLYKRGDIITIYCDCGAFHQDISQILPQQTLCIEIKIVKTPSQKTQQTAQLLQKMCVIIHKFNKVICL